MKYFGVIILTRSLSQLFDYCAMTQVHVAQTTKNYFKGHNILTFRPRFEPLAPFSYKKQHRFTNGRQGQHAIVAHVACSVSSRTNTALCNRKGPYWKCGVGPIDFQMRTGVNQYSNNHPLLTYKLALHEKTINTCNKIPAQSLANEMEA